MLNKKALSATAQVEKDSNFNQTVLLLHGDGTNGAQNNTFTDSSTNAFSITRNGNTTQGTFSPFSVGASEWSNHFNGTTDYLTTSATQLIPTGDFTIEVFVFCTSSTNNQMIVSQASGTTSGRTGLYIEGGNYQAQIGNTDVTTSTAPRLNQWDYVVFRRSSNSLNLYVNGVSVGSNTTSNTPENTILSIGRNANWINTYYWNGYISNLKISSTAITVGSTPTSPLTSDGNTKILTCQANRFVDNSSNAYAITRNGSVSVQAFSPFAPTAAYSAATNGGSGYFDGSGDDYLSVANNTALQLGSGDFTVEFWLNFSALSGYQTVFEKGYTNSGGILIQTNNNVGTLLVYASGSAVITASSSSSVGVWDHYALVRSGSTLTLYRNGLSVGSATNSTNFSTTDTLYIGGSTGGGGYYTNGYISNFRIVKGTAVYTAAFTPPTAPLTAITNTSLLCNFTNAGIIDQTAKNVLETVGNAQIDTGTKKFGTGSLEFDGTGDYLTIPSTPNLTFGTGDFTVEFWIYTAGNGNLINPATSTGSGFWGLLMQDGGLNWNNSYNVSNRFSVTATSIQDSAWHHVAVVRSSGVFKVFFDGVSQSAASGTFTDTTNYSGVDGWKIGSGNLTDFNGYIDDLRITKGVARYTANFTAPTKAFANQ